MTIEQAQDYETADSAPLRIGFFSESFHPVQNGVTTSMLTLMAELRAQKHHVVVFAPHHQQQKEPENFVLRFPSFVSIFNREYPLAYPFVPRLKLAPYFNRLKLNIVHTHTPFVLGLTGANLALSRGVPLVTTFHTLYSQYSHYVPFLPDAVTQGLLEYYLPWYYNRCAEIICPSEVAADTLRDLGIERPIEVIPTGIPLPQIDLSEHARYATRARLDLAPDAPLLLYVGRIAREKNVGWLIETFAYVRASLPNARLLVVGGGPYLDEMRALAEESGVMDGVLFLGPTPHAELNALYAAADVFCFPSPSETQGLVIGEARAAGLPCVVVNAGGAPETVRNGIDGFRTPPEDKEAFAARILEILQHPALRCELRANALRNAHDFTPETMARRVAAIYERARPQSPIPDDAHAPLSDVNADWEAVSTALHTNSGSSGQQ